MRTVLPLEDRLMRRRSVELRVPELGECWVWTGAAMPAGYGVMQRGRRGEGLDYVHRLAYELFVGDIPDGYEVDHLCKVTLCFRAPEHLEAVTPLVNVSRSDNWNCLKDRCPKGHPYDEENTRLYDGRRYCRACKRDREHRLS